MENINPNESDILKIVIRFLSMNNPSCNVVQNLIKKMHNNDIDQEELEQELNQLEHNMREHKESIKIEVQNIKNKNGKQLETSNFFKQSRIPCSNPRLRKVSKNQNFTVCFNSKNDAIKGIEYIKQNYTYDIIGFTEKSKSFIEKEDMNKNQFSKFIEQIIQNTFKNDAKINQMEEQIINQKRKQEQRITQQLVTNDEKDHVCLPLKKLKKEDMDQNIQEINIGNLQNNHVQKMQECPEDSKIESENNQNEQPQIEVKEKNLNLQNCQQRNQNCELDQENVQQNVQISEQNIENRGINLQEQEQFDKNLQNCEFNQDKEEKHEQNQENSELSQDKSEHTQEIKSPQYSQQVEEQDDDEEEEEVQVFSQSNQNLINLEQIQVENDSLQNEQPQNVNSQSRICLDNQISQQQEKNLEKLMNLVDSCQEINSQLQIKVLDIQYLKEIQVEVLSSQDLNLDNQNKDEKSKQKTDQKILYQSTNQHQQPKQFEAYSQQKTDKNKNKADKQISNKDQIKEPHSQKQDTVKSSSNHHDKKKDNKKSNKKDYHQKNQSKSNAQKPEKQKSINKDQKKSNQNRSQKQSKKH
ncbi:hypothetical protein ABPG72_002257 [Tetrahymena utriculariae]